MPSMSRRWPTRPYRDGSRRRARSAERRGFQDFGSGAGAGLTWPFGGQGPMQNPHKDIPGRYAPAAPPNYGPGGANAPSHTSYGSPYVPYGPGSPGAPGGGQTPFRPNGGGWGWPGGAAGAAALARLGLRALPWIGLVIAGYELWQWWKHSGGKWSFKMMGYNLQVDCNRSTDRIATSGLSGCSGTQAKGPTANLMTRPANLFEVCEGSCGLSNFQRTNRHWVRVGAIAPSTWSSRFLPSPAWDPFDHDPDAGVTPQPYPAPEPVGTPKPTTSPHAPDPVRGEPLRNPQEPYWPWPEEGWPGWPTPVPQPQPQPGPVTAGPKPTVPPQPTPLPPPPQGAPGNPIPPAISFGPRGRPRRQRPRNRPQKPRKGTKERKLIMTPGARSVLGWFLNLATESGDIIDALWWALPPSARTPPTWLPEQERWVSAGLARKAVDVWEGYDQIDLEAAMKNLLMNQLGDMLAGKMGKATAAANRNMWNQGYSPNNGFSLGRGPAL